jgi:hypothetical protein
MKTYDVTIQATIVKTIRVQAEDEDAAYVEAHERFHPALDYTEERYDEETVDLREVLA